jgi:hypothetical protein
MPSDDDDPYASLNQSWSDVFWIVAYVLHRWSDLDVVCISQLIPQLDSTFRCRAASAGRP